VPNSIVTLDLTLKTLDGIGAGSSVILDHIFPTLQFPSTSVFYSGYQMILSQSFQPIFTTGNASVLIVHNAGTEGFIDLVANSVITPAGATYTLSPGGVFLFFNPPSASNSNVYVTAASIANDTNVGIIAEWLYAL
jgi:hypothetical protein